jgi:ParB family chromosome partitioning protein
MVFSKLGKSFSEIIEDNQEEAGDLLEQIDVSLIRENPNQPRKTFDENNLKELSRSIDIHGLIQPIVVLRRNGGYELVAGERRLRAVRLLAWRQIPARILDLDENHSLQVALIENIQREDLNVMDSALAYRELITRFGLTQEQLAQQLGKDRSTITNTLRLLELPEKVQRYLKNSQISMGHARALLSLENKAEMEMLAEKIFKEKLSVREIESLIKNKKSVRTSTPITRKIDPNVQAASRELAEILGTKVSIKDHKNKGRIIIEYYNADDFDRLKKILSLKAK